MKSASFFKTGILGIVITLLAIFILSKAVEFQYLDIQEDIVDVAILFLIILSVLSLSVTLYGGYKNAKSDCRKDSLPFS